MSIVQAETVQDEDVFFDLAELGRLRASRQWREFVESFEPVQIMKLRRPSSVLPK
jgi:hypothetical protein